MDYVDHMRSETLQSFDKLLADVHEVVLTDFPDHENVGDSAIALGELEYFAAKKIKVVDIYCVGTLYKKVYETRYPVVIHGGGNFGGLYPAVENHRYAMAQRLNPGSLLIQAPQSVHFVSEVARENFEGLLATRTKFRMAVRDNLSASRVSDALSDYVLSPDAVHMLGHIQAPPPSQQIIVLARTDAESAVGSDLDREESRSVDWLKDYTWTRQMTLLRWKYRYLGRLGDWLNPSVDRWKEIAQSRMDRGVSILATGETVVTDRLHAMLIGLQMGRRVVAIDNNNRKLSSYADTWFGSSNPDVTFASSFEDAIQIASRR